MVDTNVAVCAGGILGMLISPNIMIVIYGPAAIISVDKLFMVAFIAGFVLSVLYVAYVGISCAFDQKLSPVIPKYEEIFVNIPLIIIGLALFIEFPESIIWLNGRVIEY